MGSNTAWSENEIHALFRLRQQGIDFSVIGRRLGRSTDACRVKYNTMRNIYPNIKTRERAPRKYSSPRYSMCWICAKVCNGCKKPVKGWKATKVVNHDGESYFVKQCPEYEPEPWVDKYDCSEFFQNPKKAVKNGKTSRP